MTHTPPIRIKFFHSLIARSIVSTLCLLILIFGSINYLSIIDMKSRVESELIDEARYIGKISAEALSMPLWNLDTTQIRQQISALKGSNNSCGSRVTSTTGEVNIASDFAPTGTKYIIHRENITFPKILEDGKTSLETIGVLELCIVTDIKEKNLHRLIWAQIFFFIIISLAVLTTFYISLTIITQPLLRIRAAMSRLSETMEPITDADLLRSDEIGAVARSFNKMVADLLRTYNELTAAKEHAIKADNAKSEFLANMSHELRTPLNNIIGISQIVDTANLSEENRELMGIIRKSSQNLLHIVNDILDISKIEANEMQLENIPFPILDRIRHAVTAMKPMASRKGYALHGHYPDHDIAILGDPLRFERILINLIGNAIQYTDAGSVTVRTRIESETDSAAVVYCEVIDTGIGIEKEKLGSIFEKFTQADTSNTRRYGGTGLGLTITRELVELMGGTIGVESTPGEGTTFWFRIPFVKAAEQAEPAVENHTDEHITHHPGAIPAAEIRVLVAEDHELNQAFMTKLFKSMGVENFTIIGNGREAVELVENQNFDLVLMDCHMPEINGYDATRAIRNLTDSIASEIPIVAMTANAMAEDRALCLEAGMNDFISKPFEIADFKKILSQWIIFPQTEKTTPADNEQEHVAINLELLNSSSMGDNDYILSMIGLFVNLAEDQLGELATHCTDGENAGWVEIAHGLKGTAGVVGADDLLKLAAKAQLMENAAQHDRIAMHGALKNEFLRIKRHMIKTGLYKI